MAAFSRDDERDSDKCGVANAMAAGHDPLGLATFTRKLVELVGGGQRSTFEGLPASHPATAERIADLEERIARAGDPGGPSGEGAAPADAVAAVAAASIETRGVGPQAT